MAVTKLLVLVCLACLARQSRSYRTLPPPSPHPSNPTTRQVVVKPGSRWWGVDPVLSPARIWAPAADIHAKDVVKSHGRPNPFFHTENRTPLRNLTVDLQGPGPIAVLGESGSGKTAFLKCLAGCDALSSGSLEVTNRPHREVLYVTKNFLCHWTKTVEANVRQLVQEHSRYHSREQQEQLVDRLILMTELAGKAHTQARELSGGEVFKLGLALALAKSCGGVCPPVLLLDEFLKGEDSRVRVGVAAVIDRLAGEFGATVLFTTHNINHVWMLAHTVMVLDSGKLSEVSGVRDSVYIRGKYEFEQFKLELDMRSSRPDSSLMDSLWPRGERQGSQSNPANSAIGAKGLLGEGKGREKAQNTR